MCTAETLNIRMIGVLGAFAAVLDDLNFKFSQESMPPWTSVVCSCFTVQFTQKRQQTRVQTNYQSIHSYITSPYWWESKSVLSRDMEVMWENWKVRIDLAKHILQRSCKSGANLRTNAAVCNATVLVSAISFFKKARVCTYHTLHTGALGTGGENYTA